MNETINQSIINEIDFNKPIHYISFLSRTITAKVVEYLSNKGIIVSSRWVSVLMVFICLLMIYAGLKISKPIIRFILVLLGVLLLIGLIIPVW